MAGKVDGVKAAKVSPAFLHANSTSHTWPFSAIAELLDNAYDPDVGATEIWIDHRFINGEDTLCFVDNGNGMNHEKLYKMLSFGYCDKVQIGNVKPIGYYGNGFKSGSMRLGKDALVFTRCTTSTSVGLLSQTYLKAINAESVLVPIVTWDLPSYTKQNKTDAKVNLQAILEHSLFRSDADLFTTLKSLESMRTGTTIIIYNLKKDKHGTFELDFKSDIHDIRNPETAHIDMTNINRPVVTSSHEYRRSLREYCSILYLKPRMKIVLRGKKVKSQFISKSLVETEKDVYKPGWLDTPVKLIFGFTTSQEPENYGLMMYHKNRLIRAYEKIGCQTKANDHGVGVVGVVEVDFLEPIHNKQKFNRDEKYTAFMQNAAGKLNDYYYEKTNSRNPDKTDLSTSQLPDWTWVQCDNCLQWRRLPTGYTETLPDKWYCRQNPDSAFNRCDIPEEPEDDDEALQVSYRKTYKKKQEEKRRMMKEKEEQERIQKEKMLKEKEMLLKKKEREIKRQTTELSEVSSSADKVDRKPTIADLDQAKQSLKAYQKKLLDQQATIQKLEEQKRLVEEQKAAMLRMADSLKLSTVNNQELMEEVQNIAGTSSSTVTSSSPSFHAPKRKSEMTDEIQAKAIKIKKEKLDDVGLIDLTEDDSEDTCTMAPSTAEPANEDTVMDSCPVEIDIDTKRGNSGDKLSDKGEQSEVKQDGHESTISIDISDQNKVFVQKSSQTVPTIVKFVSPEEMDLTKLSSVDARNMLLDKNRDVEDLKTKLQNLQGNIWKLLKIIVPDFDYGKPENIESVILDFIKVNGEQGEQAESLQEDQAESS